MPILHAAVETLGAGVHGLDDRPPSPSRDLGRQKEQKPLPGITVRLPYMD